MTLVFPPRLSLSFLSAVAALFMLDLDSPLIAQGLSGPPQRLEETLNSSQQSGASSSRPPGAGSQAPSASSGPPSGGSGPPSGGSGPPSGGSGPPSGGSGPPSGGSGPPSGGSGPPSGGNADQEMMMMQEQSYGGSNSGPPTSRRARATGTPQADAMYTYGASLISLMDDLDLSPLFGSAEQVDVESGPVLAREAEQAFKAGNQGLALELLFGHMTTEYQDAMVALRTVKYSTTIKRPVWNIRWGVSMAVRGDVAGDPQPIREGATPNRLAGGPRGGQEYGQEYGQEMQEQMEEQGMDEQMEMQMEMQMEQMNMRGGASGHPTGRAAASTRSTMPVREMLSAETQEALDKTIGLVATVIGEEFSKRFQNGDFGPAFATVSAPAPAPVSGGGGRALVAAPIQSSMSEALNDALTEVAEPLPMWKPGIVYLGLVDSFNDVVPAARSSNIDLVLHFDVVLKAGRNEMVQNISRCRLINVATAKSMGVTKGFDNREAAQLAAAGRMGERAYIEQQLGNLLAIIDRDVKVIDLPKLSPDVARRRIGTLVSSPTSRTLRTLAEIRLYQALELIEESEVEAAFDIVGGPDALMLLHGALKERIAMARTWAVESQSSGGR